MRFLIRIYMHYTIHEWLNSQMWNHGSREPTTGLEHPQILVSVAGPETNPSQIPREDYIQIYSCLGVCAPNSHVVQESTVYTMKYYSSIKKIKILSFITKWMDLEGIMLSEISQIKTSIYCMISLICGI